MDAPEKEKCCTRTMKGGLGWEKESKGQGFQISRKMISETFLGCCMAKRIKAALEYKKQVVAVNQGLSPDFFMWVKSALLLQLTSKESWTKDGVEKTKKRPVGMGKWEILGKDFFHLVMRSSGNQKFSEQCWTLHLQRQPNEDQEISCFQDIFILTQHLSLVH